MNLGDVRTMVRDISDLDTVDLSNTLLDTFIEEAFQRVIALERRWPFYQDTYTLNTAANQRSYDIANIGDIREIISIVETTASGNRFTEIAYDDAEDIWLGNMDVPGRPYFWATWANQIHLYPKPDVAYPLTIRAYRNPTYGWLQNTTTEIDMDNWFHILLAYYALARVYQRQEDNEMATMYQRSFEEGVAMARRDLMKARSHRPLLLSGGKKYPTMRRWLQTLGATLGS